MRFICVMEQEEESCDYAIGCGVTYDIIEAETRVEAIEVAIVKCNMDDVRSGACKAEHYIDGERALKTWKLFRIMEEIDLFPMLQEWGNAQYEAEIAEKEAREQAEFERLSKLYHK